MYSVLDDSPTLALMSVAEYNFAIVYSIAADKTRYNRGMSIRFATQQEIADWDKKILANPDKGNLLQGKLFAEIKVLGGWKPNYVIAGDIVITILSKKVLSGGTLWYIPRGPGVVNTTELRDILPELKIFAAKHGAFAVKIEPELLWNEETERQLTDMDLLKVRRVQPSSTVLINLEPSLDDIMANLNQKGRNALRRAEREGATVEKVHATAANCYKFYELLSATADGQFSIHAFEYYEKFWQDYSKAGMGQMFFAYNGSELIAAAYAIVIGQKSIYKDGASVRERPIYGASHLLQWHVIEWAKQQGSKQHDLYGAPHSAKVDDKSDAFYGIGTFKRSFNKHVTDYVGTYDMVVKKSTYNRWRKFGERLTRALWWRIHQENWY